MSQHDDSLLNCRTAAEIRDVQFTRRMRGLDEFEVDEFLEILAVQVEATDRVLRRLRQENERLRARNAALEAENDALRAEAERPSAAPVPSLAPEATPRAAALLRSAQMVADALLEEAVERARDLFAEASAEARTRRHEAEVDEGAVPLDPLFAPEAPTMTPRRSWQLDRTAAG